MAITIRQGNDADLDALVDLSLAAWVPVFDSFHQIMGPTVFAHLYPDWRTVQRETVATLCKERENAAVWLAESARHEAAQHKDTQRVAGYVAYEINPDTKTGEVLLLAVHPDFQNQGIAHELNQLALTKLKAHGMQLAVVGTGGDPGHAPARRAYEKAGYTPFPQVWYFQAL